MTSRFRPTRRLFAQRAAMLIAIFGVAVGRAEQILPDLHGGRAVLEATVDAADAPKPGDSSPNPALPVNHSVHVDHCSHVHLFVSLGAENASGGLANGSLDFPSASRRPDSVSGPPHVRPPIA